MSIAKSAIALLGLVCLCTSGCGSSATVHGTVTAEGKKVVWGSVTILDRDGQYHQSEIDLEGNYSVSGVPPGPVQIAVVSPDPGGRDAPRGGVSSVGGAAAEQDPREKFFEGKTVNQDTRPRPAAGQWFPIDTKFNDPESSGLTAEVKGGDNKLDLDLKK